MRTIIEVPDDIIKNLDRVSKQEQKSRAAVVREAIQLYLDKKQVVSSEVAFGLWKKRVEDGLQYQKKIRAEWD